MAGINAGALHTSQVSRPAGPTSVAPDSASSSRGALDRAAPRRPVPPAGPHSRCPSGPELPWATTATPRRPSRIAPPVLSGSISRRRPPSAGRRSSPPTAAIGFERAASETAPPTARAVPSSVFSTTLPVKPSVTTTSAPSASRSRPSTLPVKLRAGGLGRGRRVRRRAALVPLPASSPIDSRATRGRSTPSTSLRERRAQVARTGPGRPRAPRCSRRRRASRSAGRRAPGSGAGRSARAGARPGCAAGRRAPRSSSRRWGRRCTSASEPPSATSAAAMTIEASLRERTAATGSSSLVISPAPRPARRRRPRPGPRARRGRRRRAGECRRRRPTGAPAIRVSAPCSAPRPSSATVGAPSGTYSSGEASGRPSPISCEITSRPA